MNLEEEKTLLHLLLSRVTSEIVFDLLYQRTKVPPDLRDKFLLNYIDNSLVV